MSDRSSKFKIGLFVVATCILGVVGLIWLGASRYFESSQYAVAYFLESVQGLDQDSPVKFKGVTVGRVAAIRMAPDAELIEVVMGLNEDFRITDDLGVKISLLGITGQKYLELDRFPKGKQSQDVELAFEPRYQVIETYPSDIKEFGTALDNMFRKVKTVDLERISAHLLNVTARLDKMLADPKVETIGADAAEAVVELKQAATRLNESIERMQPARRVADTLDKSGQLIKELTHTTRNADRLIRRTDNNLNRLSLKFERSADNLIDITRMIKDNPRTILFGAPDEEKRKRE